MPEENDIPQTEGIAELSDMATALYLAELKVEEAEEALKSAKAAARKIAEVDIPELMNDIGMREFTTRSGIKLSIQNITAASITADRKSEAHAWLDEHDQGHIIKRNVVVGFSKGEGDKAKALRTQLEADGMTVKTEEGVHSSTLRSWAKTQLEDGADIPMDLFGVKVFNRCKITARPESMFGE